MCIGEDYVDHLALSIIHASTTNMCRRKFCGAHRYLVSCSARVFAISLSLHHAGVKLPGYNVRDLLLHESSTDIRPDGD